AIATLVLGVGEEGAIAPLAAEQVLAHGAPRGRRVAAHDGVADRPVLLQDQLQVGALASLGCLMDMAPLILICTPILVPVVVDLGVDPVHFGIIMLLNLGIGLLTPPVGATLFVGCAVGN